MTNHELSEKGKWMISLYTTLAFLVIANPLTYKLVNFVCEKIGFSIANEDGCPNEWGLLLHAVVFFFLIRLMMVIKLPGLQD